MPEFEDEEIQLPPQSIEAEQGVIGCALVWQHTLLETGKILKPSDFKKTPHQIIWSTILNQWQSTKPVNLASITAKLREKGKLEKIGGPLYLHELVQASVLQSDAGYFAEEVKKYSNLRNVIEIADRAKRGAYEAQDLQELISEITNQISELELKKNQANSISIKDIMPKAMERLKLQQENKGSVTGVPTGLWDLDTTLFGLKPGNLIVIAARPSMGKTALALNIAKNVAVGYEIPTLFISLEMGEEELALRLLSSQADFDANKFNTGEISQTEIDHELRKHAEKLAETKLDIADESYDIQTVEDIRALVEKRKSEGITYGLIILDYLQLMEGLAEGNRANEVAEVSRKLKKLAATLELPLIALSQVSRSCEARPNKRPNLADLRESGAIEQDSSVVMFIYRDDYYNKESTDQGMAEIIIAKNRGGKTGAVKLRFRPDRQHFESVSNTGRYMPRITAPAVQPLPELLDQKGLEETLNQWENEGGESNVAAQFKLLFQNIESSQGDVREIHLRNCTALEALWESKKAAQVVKPAQPVYADLDIFNQ